MNEKPQAVQFGVDTGCMTMSIGTVHGHARGDAAWGSNWLRFKIWLMQQITAVGGCQVTHVTNI